ncbi:YfhO family protein [Cellulosilyticum ruminicola]|uniref:YfhO family protein n=1 Tax=Cellulosilyticum ruminicola TaxID=425254 RepID=UPI00241F3634|nr:YfhO family protein [Cellulosilyticum ruminicola]
MNQGLKVTKWKDGYIEGDITNTHETQLLMTSILYDPGWRIKVDGKKQDILAIQNALLGCRLSPGTHHIILYYEVPGFKIGLCISLFTLVIILTVHRVRRQQR